MIVNEVKAIPSELPENLEITGLARVARFPNMIGTFMARDALSLVASHIALTPKDAVLLPIYNCQDVLKAFARTNRVVFYDIQADLTVDPTEILEKLKDDGIRMMMITNYFGFLQPHRDEIKKICQERNISLIEDCAHSLLTEGSGETGDLSIYSFRKILPIPDGGGLRIKREGKPPDVRFYPRVYSDALSAFISLKAFLNVRSEKFSRASLMSQANKVAPEITSRTADQRILPLSHFAEMGMTNLSFPEIMERRRSDFRFWQEICKGIKSVVSVFSDLPTGVCPLGFPVIVENRESVESRARKAGVVLRVHWRLDSALGSECRVSHKLTRKMLTLPLYPELKDGDRRVLSEIINSIRAEGRSESVVGRSGADLAVRQEVGCLTQPISARDGMENLKVVRVPIAWHPGLPIYASEPFLKTVADEYGWLGGYGESGKLRCMLPYTIIRKATLRMVRFRVETISLGEKLDLREERSFLNSVVEYFRSTGADVIIPAGNTAIFRTYPDGAVVAPYGTYIKNIDQPEEALASEIRKTFRQNIRKALEHGVEIKSGMEYLDDSYAIIANTLKRSGIAFKTHSEFRRMILNLGEYVKIFVADYNGTIQGCMVAPFSEYSAYNCYAGTRNEPLLGAMHLLHWEAMRHFRSIGVKRFDFQGVRIDPEKGSKQDGIANYKKGFGGQLVKGYTWKYPLRPLKAIGYSLAVRLLKGGDIVDLERHKLSEEKELV